MLSFSNGLCYGHSLTKFLRMPFVHFKATNCFENEDIFVWYVTSVISVSVKEGLFFSLFNLEDIFIEDEIVWPAHLAINIELGRCCVVRFWPW